MTRVYPPFLSLNRGAISSTSFFTIFGWKVFDNSLRAARSCFLAVVTSLSANEDNDFALASVVLIFPWSIRAVASDLYNASLKRFFVPNFLLVPRLIPLEVMQSIHYHCAMPHITDCYFISVHFI